MEIYTIEPNGSNETCVTCLSSIPKGFTGQPEWHPNGEYLILQARNTASLPTADDQNAQINHPSFGVNQDLWLVKKDGTAAEKIYTTPLDGAALHPHFDPTGTKLIFAERMSTGIPPSVWSGWNIQIADFDINAAPGAKLSNHRRLYDIGLPHQRGFYETHAIDNERIVFSWTPCIFENLVLTCGRPYSDDSYSANLDGSNRVNLINSPETWDEHATYFRPGTLLHSCPAASTPAERAPTVTTSPPCGPNCISTAVA